MDCRRHRDLLSVPDMTTNVKLLMLSFWASESSASFLYVVAGTFSCWFVNSACSYAASVPAAVPQRPAMFTVLDIFCALTFFNLI